MSSDISTTNPRLNPPVLPQRPVKPAIYPVSNGNTETVSQSVTEASGDETYIPRKERRRMEQQQMQAKSKPDTVEATVPVEEASPVESETEAVADETVPAEEHTVSQDDVKELLGFHPPATSSNKAYSKHASKVVKQIFQMPKDHKILSHEVGIIVDDVLWGGPNNV